MVSASNGAPCRAVRRVGRGASLEKGIEIVDLLASVAAGLTISEIAVRRGHSINEVFARWLCETGMDIRIFGMGGCEIAR